MRPDEPGTADRGTDAPVTGSTDLRTIDEVAAAAGLTVRTVRFYATKGLLPPPRLRGRVGWYDAGHLARLVLIRDLQAAGFTLTAIERFVARIPASATADDVAVFQAMLTPWVASAPEELTRAELDTAAGRAVDDPTLAALTTVGLAEPLDGDRVRVRPAELTLGLELLDLDVPEEMLVTALELIETATGELAGDLAELLRHHLLRPYLAGELDAAERAALAGVIERLRPLLTEAVLTALHTAVDRAVRARVGAAPDQRSVG